MFRTLLAVAASLLLTSSAFAGQDHQHATPAAGPVRPTTGLGSHHHRISTGALKRSGCSIKPLCSSANRR